MILLLLLLFTLTIPMDYSIWHSPTKFITTFSFPSHHCYRPSTYTTLVLQYAYTLLVRYINPVGYTRSAGLMWYTLRKSTPKKIRKKNDVAIPWDDCN